jgi:hypothetical protein
VAVSRREVIGSVTAGNSLKSNLKAQDALDAKVRLPLGDAKVRDCGPRYCEEISDCGRQAIFLYYRQLFKLAG